MIARFANDQVSFHRGDHIVLTGKRTGNTLYLLDLKPLTTSADADNRIKLTQQAGLRASLLIWHQRLGHMNHQTILKMISQDLIAGLHLTSEKIPKTLCAPCEFGKFHRQPLKTGRTRATRIGELVHSDVEGPMPFPSIGHARYYVLFTDDFSGWRVVYFMKSKSEVPALFRLFVASLLNETGNTVRTLRSDNGGEYEGNDFKRYLAEKGIRHETSAAYTPAQNGVAERGNRTLLDGARSMLFASNLPSSLWAEAIGYLVYIRNRVLSSTITMTPFEAWNGRKPDLSNIRIFGSRAFVRCPNTKKLDARCLEGAFVGISNTQKASRIYISSPPPRVIVSYDVKIDETVMYQQSKNESAPQSIERVDKSPLPITMPVDNDLTVEVTATLPNDTPGEILDRPATPVHDEPAIRNNEEDQVHIDPENNNNDNEAPTEANDVNEATAEIRRSSRHPQYTERYQEYRRSLGYQAAVTSSPNIEDSETQPVEPSTYMEAITGPDAENWIPAIFDEYESLIQKFHMDLVPTSTWQNGNQG